MCLIGSAYLKKQVSTKLHSRITEESKRTRAWKDGVIVIGHCGQGFKFQICWFHLVVGNKLVQEEPSTSKSKQHQHR